MKPRFLIISPTIKVRSKGPRALACRVIGRLLNAPRLYVKGMHDADGAELAREIINSGLTNAP